VVCLITGLSEENSGYHNSVLSYHLTSPSATKATSGRFMTRENGTRKRKLNKDRPT
jgi:hypothetical protein